ncbi:MAG: response regulator [bacterium]|nr:response regulator [bacterium]
MPEKKKRILLIEDERTIANLIELRLKRSGYEVEVIYDGIKGLKTILESPPDLVLLDMLLSGLSGFDILKTLKEKNLLPNLPVIIISNSAQPVQLKRAVDLGARGYLIKVNFSPEEVVEKVEAVFKEGIKQDSLSESNVLLVEDEKFLADAIERTFTQKQYKVLQATNAREARNILGEEKVDVILLDIILPDIDGFQFLEELKKDDKVKGIPVIIISNLGQKEEIEKGKKMGAIDYIIKSDTIPSEILEKVESILKSN